MGEWRGGFRWHGDRAFEGLLVLGERGIADPVPETPHSRTAVTGISEAGSMWVPEISAHVSPHEELSLREMLLGPDAN